VLFVGVSNNNFVIIIISQIARGIGSEPLWSLAYSYLADVFSDNIRPRYILILSCIGNGGAYLLMGIIYALKIDWLYFIIIFQIIPIFFIFYWIN
jgi:MFS family permease